MSYIVLARKYRPQTFGEVIGQETVTRTLRNAIEMDRIPHACLFSGPRGIGKTTMARIFAKALDCEKGPTPDPCNECEICKSIWTGDDIDVLEIDGASNNSVDDVRDLREKAQFTTARARYKIYIIDEVHMLSKSAFNALLKTLEEPPPHVKFIFATTELNRVPDTIQSRCQRFDFYPLRTGDIVNKLKYLCDKEGAAAEDGALAKIAEHAEGSMRDAESALDQVISLGAGKVTSADVDEMLGTVSDENLFEIVDAALKKDVKRTLNAFHQVIAEGSDTHMLTIQLTSFARDLAVMETCGSDTKLVKRAESVRPKMEDLSKNMTGETFLYASRLFCITEREMLRSPHPNIHLEMCLMKLGDAGDLESITELIKRVEGLAAGMGGENITRSGRDKTPAPGSIDAEGLTAGRGEENITRSGRDKTPTPPSIGSVRESWGGILSNLKNGGKMATAALLKEAEPFQLDKDKLVIGIHSGFKFHKEHLEEFENRQLVEDAIEQMLGFRYDIQFVTLGDESPQYKNRPREHTVPSAIQEDPSVRKAAEIFNATVVSVKK